MTFPTVKSSKWGESKHPKCEHLWAEWIWKKMVLDCLLELPIEIRHVIAKLCYFEYSKEQLSGGGE